MLLALVCFGWVTRCYVAIKCFDSVLEGVERAGVIERNVWVNKASTCFGYVRAVVPSGLSNDV